MKCLIETIRTAALFLGLALLIFLGMAVITLAEAGPVLPKTPAPKVTAEDTSERAPATAAIKLYAGCITGIMMSRPDIEPTRVGINYFLKDLDSQCLSWMLIWHPALLNGADLTANQVDVDKFSAARLMFMQMMTDRLREQAMIR